MTSEIIPGVGGAAFVALDATDFDFSAFFLRKAFHNNMCVCFAFKKSGKIRIGNAQKTQFIFLTKN